MKDIVIGAQSVKISVKVYNFLIVIFLPFYNFSIVFYSCNLSIDTTGEKTRQRLAYQETAEYM